MPADEQDERPVAPTPPEEGAPLKFEEVKGDAPLSPLTPKGRRAGWRRVVNRRNAMWTLIVGVVAAVALVFIIFILYRTGKIDRIIAGQIVDTLAKYNVRAEIGSFETKFNARTVELRDLKLYNSVTGAQIGKVDRILAKVRIEDMWSLNLRRNVNLEELTVDRPEIWVVYDAQGRSNFSELQLPPPDPNSRILFAYSTALIRVNDAVVHYDDRRYDISGEAKNVRAFVRPEDPNAPAESRANLIDLSLSGSTFALAGRAVTPIDIEARVRADQTRADISELVLRSPVAEARLSGSLDDWRKLSYQMQVNATVDLTQTSDVLQLETTMRGTGRFEGKVTGDGDKYKVEGQIVSDALAADGVRLKALNVNATASGQGKSYEAQGRAVAELLTAGDFQINMVQLVGGVTGTGADFRWLGELRAAAARSGATSVTGLIAKDAVAEMRDGNLSGEAQTASANSILMQGTRVNGAQASGLRFNRAGDGATHATISSARAGTIVSGGASLGGVQASGVDATINADSSAAVTVERVSVAGVNAAGARTGSINIAGVRLSVSPGGRVEGTTGDIGVGTVAFTTPAVGQEAKPQQGRVENVRLARPRFTLEPGGRYRASADLSLGGGVLGEMPLGKARAAVVATNEQIQLNDFVADIFNGNARGNATIATSGRAQSSVKANFENVDAGGLVAIVSGNAVPLTGAATGTVDLRFPGTNFKAASGRLDAQFSGATGRDESARTPLTGDLALTADRGLFEIERANLRAGATELTATGRFSFEGGSDLAVNLNSTDAAELQSVAFSTGLLSSIEERIKPFSIHLAGNLRFNGTVKGDLDNPLVNGRFELASMTMRGRDLGALSADIASDAEATRITGGRLVETDGGGATFAAVIPRAGENNISFDATLEGANAGNLAAALGLGGKSAEQLAGLGAASGKVSVAGFPGAMSGSADLRVAAGRIGTQPYDEITARATFNGTRIMLDKAEARLGEGNITATGGIEIGEGSGGLPSIEISDFRVQGTNVPLTLLTQNSGAANLPVLSGTTDFTATLSGNPLDPRTLKAEINAQGRDVTINGQPAGQLSLVGHMTQDQKFVLELTTGIFGSQPQVVRATVDLAAEDDDEGGIYPITAETTFTGADLTPLFTALINNPKVKVTGRATGTVKVSGPLATLDIGFTTSKLSGRAEFTELTVQVEDVPLTAENPLVVTFKPNEVTFERTRFTGPGTNIRFGGTAALGAGGTQNLDINGDLNMRVLSNAQRNIFLSGIARMGVHVGGTFGKPEITGTASVAGASLALLVSDTRLTATSINGQLRFNENQVSIESLTGRLGGGRLTATGGALIEGFMPTQFYITARGDNVTIPAAAFVTLPPFLGSLPTTADAELEIRGSVGEGQNVKGTINVRRTEITEDIDLADIINAQAETTITEGGGGGGGAGLFGTTTLDLTIAGRDALIVRNNLADAVGSLNLRVRGPSEAPIRSGRITMTRGTITFRNDRYEIQRAVIDLPPRADADPIVNIQAQSDIRGYRVTVTMSGPLSGGLQTTASSDPPLPQADVIALITTGNLSGGPEGTSTLAQTGLGTATSLLTDTLINAPVQRATDKLFGLNRFEFDPLITGRGGQSPTARLTVGRQINRNLAITFSTNVTGEPNQVIAVEYRVSDRLSFIAQYQQGSTDTLRTRSNNFNFELRFRKRY